MGKEQDLNKFRATFVQKWVFRFVLGLCATFAFLIMTPGWLFRRARRQIKLFVKFLNNWLNGESNSTAPILHEPHDGEGEH